MRKSLSLGRRALGDFIVTLLALLLRARWPEARIESPATPRPRSSRSRAAITAAHSQHGRDGRVVCDRALAGGFRRVARQF